MQAITTGEMMHVYGGFGAGVDYAVRLTVRLRDPIDGELLRQALDRVQERYPYLLASLKRNENDIYMEPNPLPVVLHQGDDAVCLNTPASNGHLWAVCMQEDRIHLDTYHGLTDGDGMYRLLASLLYHYCARRYGVEEADTEGYLAGSVREEETLDPQDALETIDLSTLETPPLQPAFTLETDGGLTLSAPSIWDIEIPEEAFIRFTSAHDASPGTMVSLLLARAIDGLFPDRDKEIVNAYVINARPMLHAERTRHVCLSMALLDYSDRVRRMPMQKQCTVYRGKTFAQSYEPAVVRSMTVNASQIRAAAQAAATVEDKEQVFTGAFNGGNGYITYLVSYVGKWKYPVLGQYIREFWTHPASTFSLMAEISAAGGKIFISMQQRFREECVREAFLRQLEEHEIPYAVRRVMGNDGPGVGRPSYVN